MTRRPGVHMCLIACQLLLAVWAHDQFFALPTGRSLAVVLPGLLALLAFRLQWAQTRARLMAGQAAVHAVLVAVPVLLGESWHLRSDHLLGQGLVAVTYLTGLLALGRAIERAEPLVLPPLLQKLGRRLAVSLPCAAREPSPVRGSLRPIRDHQRTAPHLVTLGFRAPPSTR